MKRLSAFLRVSLMRWKEQRLCREALPSDLRADLWQHSITPVVCDMLLATPGTGVEKQK